jgi:predicted unusual protein kinase regulating ubiquinone biosynthesis (AarF/ABC1/UbiB family)
LSFDESPLSISVLDQTHVAVMRTNAPVIVKVQRPNVREQLYDDLQALDEVAKLFDKYSGPEEKFDFHEALQVFRRTIIAELDLRQESHNLKALCNYLKHLDLIVVPTPVENYSSSRVLTLNFLRGAKLQEAVTLNGLLKSERSKLAEQVFQAYMQQFLVDGFVHADPDPDNMLLTKDGKIAVLDLGVVDRIAPAMQTKLIQLLLSINEGRAEQAADMLISMSSQRKNFSESDFRRTVSDVVLAHRDGGMEQEQIGQVFRGIVQATAKCGAILPWELSELGAALIKLDHVARIIDPRFDTRQFVGRYVAQMMQKHMSSALSPAHIFHTVVETSEFIETLPGKISTILDSVANNDFKVTVHAIDEQVLISGFQKIANRITVGIVLAALIMGAALLMRVKTEFTIFGYPGLAILAFIAAAGCGFALVVEIFLGDRTKKTS